MGTQSKQKCKKKTIIIAKEDLVPKVCKLGLNCDGFLEVMQFAF